MRPLPFWRQGTCAEDGGYPRENRSPQRRSPIHTGTAAAPSASLPPCPGSLSGIVPILIILKVEGYPLGGLPPVGGTEPWKPCRRRRTEACPVRRNGPTLGTPLWKSRPPNLHAPIGPFSGTNPDGMPGIQPMRRRSRPSSPDGIYPASNDWYGTLSVAHSRMDICPATSHKSVQAFSGACPRQKEIFTPPMKLIFNYMKYKINFL